MRMRYVFIVGAAGLCHRGYRDGAVGHRCLCAPLHVVGICDVVGVSPFLSGKQQKREIVMVVDVRTIDR